MLASYHGREELVKAMFRDIPRKPDPNQLNGKGQSCVAGAVFKGFDAVVKILIENGADPQAGQPNAIDTARMFNKLDGEDGLGELFNNAPGIGAGGREAASAIEDREQASR